MRQPRVSIVTPTYNRHQFIEQLIRCVRLQDYPQHLIELLIMDDSPIPLILPASLPEDKFTIRLIRHATKLPIGFKRNSLNRLATGDIIIPFDDDDYYPPTRVSHVVEKLESSGLQLAGCSLLFMWFPQTDNLYLMGPFGAYHSCNGALAYTKAYVRKHQYDASKVSAEEPSFTKSFTEPMVQLDPTHTMMSLSHTQNTVPKPEKNFLLCKMPNDEKFPQFPHSSWLDFVKDEESRAFYRKLFQLKS